MVLECHDVANGGMEVVLDVGDHEMVNEGDGSCGVRVP